MNKRLFVAFDQESLYLRISISYEAKRLSHRRWSKLFNYWLYELKYLVTFFKLKSDFDKLKKVLFCLLLHKEFMEAFNLVEAICIMIFKMYFRDVRKGRPVIKIDLVVLLNHSNLENSDLRCNILELYLHRIFEIRKYESIYLSDFIYLALCQTCVELELF